MTVRLEPGAVSEDVDVPGVGAVAVRYERCPAGWQASFSVAAPETADVSVAHRLVAESLAEARRAVPEAVAFLLGHPLIDAPAE